ncbi:type 4a pilus biogenesis protein PilO [Candidatus Omnitrophota bacterium]
MDIIGLINNHKNKLLSLTVVVVALAAAAYIYKFQGGSLESLRAQKNAQIRKNQILSEIEKLQASLAVYQDALKKKDISVFMNNINNIVKESNVSIASIKPLKEKDRGVYVEFFFALSVTARDYHQLAKFISEIENYSDIFIVDSMKISQKGIVRGEGTKADLVISTLFFKG